MANSPFIDLKDEVALRRFLSDMHSTVTNTTTIIQQSGLAANNLKIPTITSKAIKDEIQARVKAFDASMWSTINEVKTNLRILIPSNADIVKTINDELKVTSSNLTATVNSTALAAIAADGSYATAQSVNALSSNLATNYATTSQLAATYATQTSVGAIYEVSVEANGHVSGYRAVATGSTPSVFQIYAEKFAISSSSTAEGYSPFQVDTVNHKINMTSNVAIDGNLLISGTVTAPTIAAGTITANKITAGHIGTAVSTTATTAISATGYYPNTPTSATIIGSLTYYNSANTSVKVLINVSGRTGVSGDTTGASAWFGIYQGSTILFNYGWSPSGQDARTMSAVATIPANSSSTFYFKGAKDSATASAYTLGSSFMISIIGVAQGG